jgi:hypothetical protein
MTQDVGFVPAHKPTILWIGREAQYKSADRIVKPTILKNGFPEALSWT